MMNTKVTIIIPAFNEAPVIQRCINSLLKQTIIPNIIVVNDGSTDETLDKLVKYDYLDNFSLINQTNQGVSVARNRGIKAATTEFITFVDADDYVEKNFVEILLEGYASKDDIDLSICNYSMRRLNNTTFCGKFKTSVIDKFKYFDSVIDDFGVNGFIYNKLFKKSIIKKYNILFNPKIAIGEDFLFSFLYGGHCQKIALNDSVQIHYLPTEFGISDTMQISGRFSPKIFSYFDANIKIIRYLYSLNTDEKLRPTINREISRTAAVASTIIRKVYLYHEINYYDKLTRLRSFIKKNWLVIMLDSTLSRNDKTKIFIAAYCPKLLNQFDKVKFT